MDSVTASMKRTLLVGLGLLGVICAGALASPARITLHFPPAAEGTAVPDPARVARIGADIEHLSVALGERNHHRPYELKQAEKWAEERLQSLGWTVERQRVDDVADNLVATRGAGSGPLVIVGAHIDTALGTPGADDNASGVAALLELARDPALAAAEGELRLVVFANEEPPYFQTAEMGSRVYAQSLENAEVRAMMVLESIGYYTEEPGTQKWPLGLGIILPRTGNFLMFVGNPQSSRLVQRTLRAYRKAASLPAAAATVPGAIPGVDWSDHAEFWRIGVQAIMVTDMPPNRNPHYHEPTDLPPTVSPARIAEAIDGLAAAIRVM
ncbi:MAG: M28 family peptidase [Deltaproteobacteria bacterium]|nr:M28 family peptidase [Deltaproteobacteria bacterium]